MTLRLSFCLALALSATSATAQDNAPAKAIAGIQFDHDFYNLGEVEEGAVVTHSYPFRNAGPDPFTIVKTETSCGCTIAKTSFREYAPGETGQIGVTLDTKGKRGIVTKSIDVYLDTAGPAAKQLILMATLKPPPHPKVENVLDVVRDPQCKTCHLESGVGQYGAFLYHRVCAQCHGARGKGASAMSFDNADWAKAMEETTIESIISQGDMERGMPPYVAGVDPALTAEQIKSLAEYLKSLSAAAGQ
ncbi:MAG: DUF1573 domain-containing protein [Nitrospinota bacterium]|nr:DUF1573 domain-containing protein [Nitrospinota bacterium]